MDQEEHPCDGLSRDRQWFTTCWPAQGAELVSWYQQQQNRAYYFFGMRTWTQNHMLASELYPQPHSQLFVIPKGLFQLMGADILAYD